MNKGIKPTNKTGVNGNGGNPNAKTTPDKVESKINWCDALSLYFSWTKSNKKTPHDNTNTARGKCPQSGRSDIFFQSQKSIIEKSAIKNQIIFRITLLVYL